MVISQFTHSTLTVLQWLYTQRRKRKLKAKLMENYSVYVTGYNFDKLLDIDQAILLQVDRQSCQSEEPRTDYRVLTAEDLVKLSAKGLEYAIGQVLDDAKTEAVDYYKDCENANSFK